MDPSGFSASAYFADFGLILFALFLVLLNGFFVAAEFAMVKLRGTRVETIADLHGWRGSGRPARPCPWRSPSWFTTTRWSCSRRGTSRS